MTDVFISYKREERDKVVLIADRLRSLGLDVWFDARLTTGHHFDREIDDHVRRARCVLVCWSEGALASEWVRAEAAIGRERNVLVPLLVEACSPPVPFNTIQTENLIGWAGEADHEGWLRAIDQIAGLVQRPELAQEQRGRGQAERDLRRTQALLEAQRREEEDAQRRAAAAAGKRAELEAQLANLGGAPAAVDARAAIPTASVAPKTHSLEGQLLTAASILGLAIVAIALTGVLFFAATFEVAYTLSVAVGAAIGVAIATWVRIAYDMRRINFNVQHFILQWVLVALASCAAIVFLLANAEASSAFSYGSAWENFGSDSYNPLRFLVFPVALVLGVLLRSLAPILGRHKFDPVPVWSPLAKRVAQVLWYIAILAPILLLTSFIVFSSTRLPSVIALSSAGIGVALATWVRSIRDARKFTLNLRSLLFQLLLAMIAMAVAVSLTDNFSGHESSWAAMWVGSGGFTLGAVLRFVLPNNGPLKDGSVRTSNAAMLWSMALVVLASLAGYATFSLIAPRYGYLDEAPAPAEAPACPTPDTACPEGAEGYDSYGCQCGLSPEAPAPAEATPAVP